LGGYLPRRQSSCYAVAIPPLEATASFALQADGKEMSTTMAFVRLLTNLLKDPNLGKRIVPIVADEARTFGMANLFKQVGIYSSVGQRYDPEDIGSLMSYREAMDGQILEEGISEAGALASWTAAATSYSVHGLAMLPFYIYYSMFGFQRVGDQIWAAADQRARGFLLGATSGRTTLGGEGLQHQDGTSHLHAATIPNCKAYDPAFAGEMAVIVQQGMQDMMVDQKDVFYYITMMNENYAQPNMDKASHEAVIKGGYRFSTYGKGKPRVTLAGSGAILNEVIKAAQSLANEGICAEVLSITSWSELARNPAYAAELFSGSGPIVAASDYVRSVPENIRAWLPKGRGYTTLGTDGFGRSDTRSVLREFFGVDAAAILAASHKAISSS
jgi:pyruvate dehydrogenase E1 component